MPRPANFECPDQLYQTMRDCWHEESANRPTFAKLYEFLEAYDPTKDTTDKNGVSPASVTALINDETTLNSYDPYPSSGSKISFKTQK